MPKKRKTLAKKLGISSSRLSKKIGIIKRESPGISPRAAVGKAAGILRPKKSRKVFRVRKSRKGRRRR